MPLETQCTEPAAYTSQWPLKRTIRDFGQQLKQPPNPYANMSQRCVLQAQVNVLKALMPEIDQKLETRLLLPHRAILSWLRWRCQRSNHCRCKVGLSLTSKLTNYKIAMENQHPLNKIRVSWFIKISIQPCIDAEWFNLCFQIEENSHTRMMFAEVLFFFQVYVHEDGLYTVAMVRF